MFASGGDPVPGGRLGPGRAPYRDHATGYDHAGGYETGYDNGYDNASPYPSPEAAAVGVARRLQARLDRHLRLLGQLQPEPPQLRELTDTVRRMRRDAESIVLLNGDDPSGHTGGPRRLSEVLDDAAAAAEETWRILVRPAAAATIEPGAAVELMYVLAELLDHVTAAYPDAGIDVASYVTARTGLTVEVSVNSASRYVPDGLGTRRAAVAAEAHARRSRSRLDARPAGGRPAGRRHRGGGHAVLPGRGRHHRGTGLVVGGGHRPAGGGRGRPDRPTDTATGGATGTTPATAPARRWPGRTSRCPRVRPGVRAVTVVAGRRAVRADGGPAVRERRGPGRHPDLRGDRLRLVPRGPGRPGSGAGPAGR